MRYVRQRDDYSCGPLSILNLCKWAGIKCSYDSEFYRWIKNGCRCKPRFGCDENGMTWVLRKLAAEYNWKVHIKADTSLKQIREELKKGNAVLLCAEYDDGDEHVALLTDYEPGVGCMAVNWFIGEDKAPLDAAYMRMLKRRDILYCWFIRKV